MNSQNLDAFRPALPLKQQSIITACDCEFPTLPINRHSLPVVPLSGGMKCTLYYYKVMQLKHNLDLDNKSTQIQ